MAKYRLDALVAPTWGPAWLIDLVNGDSYPSDAASPSTVAAVAGYPHITVPMGFHGLPLGISFFGTGMERADAHQARLRVRAGDAPPAARLRADGGVEVRRRA